LLSKKKTKDKVFYVETYLPLILYKKEKNVLDFVDYKLRLKITDLDSLLRFLCCSLSFYYLSHSSIFFPKKNNCALVAPAGSYENDRPVYLTQMIDSNKSQFYNIFG